MKIQLKRSNVLQSGAAKEPTASQLEYGELAINYSNSDPAIFLKDSNNNIIRISGVGNIADDGLTNVPAGTTPPTNPTPESGNLWYNSDEGRLYIYYVDANTSQWVDASPDSWDPTVMPVTTNPAAQTGTLDDRYVMENGDTMTGALLLDNASSASAPDLSFDGDANTGLYSPGADQVAIATGGTQRIVVDNSGKFGIGTTSPLAKLAVEFPVAGAGSDGVRLSDTTNSTVSLFGTTETSYSYAGVTGHNTLFYGSRDIAICADNANNGQIKFATGGSEQMRIDSSGNMGLGISNPSVKLHVDGTGVEVRASDNANSKNISLYGGTSANDPAITFTDNLRFYSNSASAERVRIDSAGRLGLGQTSPVAKLDVNGNQTSNVVAMAALDVDCSAGNYFTKTIYGNSTFTFSNVPSSRSFSFVLELTHSSGTVTWPSSVKFPGDTAPTLTAGKTHLFVFETNDGGTRFRGAALVDYVN
jgi:hypothetical protein